MPTFVEKCNKCGTIFDFYKLRESSEPVCPKCGNDKDFERLPSAPAFSFKGEGWQTPNYVASVDPTTVPGVKRIDNPTPQQRTLYKTKKEVTGRRKKVKVKGLPEVKRKFALGKE